MDYEKENGIITVSRGDTFELPIYINEGTKLNVKYRPLKPSERLYVGVMEPGQPFEDAIIRKVYNSDSVTDSDGNTLMIFNSIDTEYLKVGKYYYTIKLRELLTDGTETVTTLVSPTLFWITN